MRRGRKEKKNREEGKVEGKEGGRERKGEGWGGQRGTENTHSHKGYFNRHVQSIHYFFFFYQSIIFMWSQTVITEERMVHLKKPISPDPKHNHLNHLSPKDSEMSTLFHIHLKIYCSVMRNVSNMYDIKAKKRKKFRKKQNVTDVSLRMIYGLQ